MGHIDRDLHRCFDLHVKLNLARVAALRTAFMRFASNSLVACTRRITKSEPERVDFLTRSPEIGGVAFRGPRCAVIFPSVQESKSQKRPCLIGLGIRSTGPSAR